MKGQIRQLVYNKSFGFIKAKSGLDNIFLHRDNYHGDWHVLEQSVSVSPVYVEFILSDGPKGPRAEKCVRITVEEYNADN